MKPPKPECRHLSQASVKQCMLAYESALQNWQAAHRAWSSKNAVRKARARAVWDAHRRSRKATECQDTG